MQTEPTPQFINAIAAAVEYWRRRTEELDDAAIARLDAERQNLYRAVEFGLKRPETWEAAAVVALQAFDLVERRGYWREWIPMLEAAVVQCGEAQQSLRCRLLNGLGLFYRLDRQLDTAISTHREVGKLAQALNDQQSWAEALYYLSGDYVEKRVYAEAERHGAASLAVFKKLSGVEKWLATTHALIGEVACNRGELETAEMHLTEAVARWRTLNRPLALARALYNLANTLWLAGRVGEAEACFGEAVELLAPTTYELNKTMVQLGLGTFYYHQHQWDKAELAFRRADSPYLRQSGHIYYQAHVANNLGSILLERSRSVEAEHYLRRALELWQQADDNMLRGNTLGTLAQALSAQGLVLRALDLYEEAIELLKRYPDNFWAKRLLEKFAAKRKALLKEIGDVS